MDPLLLGKALIMGVVEGLTEFLPISSTGHLILAGHLLDFTSPQAQVFEVVIQSAAMLAILWEYRERFLSLLRGITTDAAQQRFLLRLVVAFLPAAVLGLLFGSAIKANLFKPVPVAIAFVVGALFILWVERGAKAAAPSRVCNVDDMSFGDAFKVGLAQCAALFPGMSRSGATIIGGMLFGLDRKVATEFSFFLAVPTLMAASGYDLLKHRDLLSASDASWFGVGAVASFASAFACIRWLIRYVSTHTFVPFAWYRLAFGGLVLLTAGLDLVAWG